MAASKTALKTGNPPPLQSVRMVRSGIVMRDEERTMATCANQLQNVIASVPCVAFELQRSRSGYLRFTEMSDNSRQLLQLEARDAIESFARFFDVLDPAECLRLEEAAAIAARKRVAIEWIGRMRVKGRRKTKWLRLQTSRPRGSTGTATWQGVITDVTREHDLDLALKRSRDQLSELSSYLEAGKEEERERIARDIHDELGSLLVALKIDAALLSSKLPKNQVALREKANSIETLLDQAMGTASRVARELRPGILKEFGLSAAIECQAEDFSARTGITCRTQCDDEGVVLEERAALAVFRIVQEALTNVAKHAHASLVALRLYRVRQQVIVEIRDNGRGVSDVDLHKPKSFGLRGIRERVRSLHGDIRITPGEQGGTHILLSLPLKGTGRGSTDDDDVQHKLF